MGYSSNQFLLDCYHCLNKVVITPAFTRFNDDPISEAFLYYYPGGLTEFEYIW